MKRRRYNLPSARPETYKDAANNVHLISPYSTQGLGDGLRPYKKILSPANKIRPALI